MGWGMLVSANRSIFLVLLALVLASPGFADWTKLSSNEFTMANPPEAGSKADKADLAEVHRLQDTRTDAQCELGKSMIDYSFENLFASELTDKELAQIDPIMERVFKLTSKIGGYFKNRYSRPRPYTADETVVPCIPALKGDRSYPSTHAALGSVGGCVLAKAFPKKASKLNKRGTLIGQMRVVVGVHHPTDVEAGQTLGKEICDRLLTEDDFLQELGN